MIDNPLLPVALITISILCAMLAVKISQIIALLVLWLLCSASKPVHMQPPANAITLHANPDTLRMFNYACRHNGRSPSAQFSAMAKRSYDETFYSSIRMPADIYDNCVDGIAGGCGYIKPSAARRTGRVRSGKFGVPDKSVSGTWYTYEATDGIRKWWPENADVILQG